MLSENISKVRPSVVAIGFKPTPDKITILGSGFAVSNDGKILSAAHLCSQIKNPDYLNNMVAMALVKKDENGLEHYGYFPIRMIDDKKDEKNDLILFQMDDYGKTMITPLELGDSNAVDVGSEAYFIGFPYAAQLINDGFGITLIANKAMISNIKNDGVDPQHPRNFIVLDAISNPGNSGCPLIDSETNKVIGVMSISFRMQSQNPDFSKLDIREPMHICAAKPINLARPLL